MPPLTCYIPSRGTARLRSHVLARALGYRVRVVVDTEHQACLARSMQVHHDEIVVMDEPCPGPPCGAAAKRDWICRKLWPAGEWGVWMDDNVERLSGLARYLTKDRLDLDDGFNWRQAFNETLGKLQVQEYVEETIARCEAGGTIMGGFATEQNFYFRGRKWQDHGYCRTQFVVYKNDGSPWVPSDCPNMMFEDMAKTVDVVARYGRVCVNRHLKAEKPLFEPGGIGSLDDRIPYLVENCRWLMAKYPGLLSLSKGRDYHVTFAKRSQATVDQWRRANGYLVD